ncbi:hypothetical protein [Dietzia cinnamea]|uniref:hypothetical protein n=1 Tax=Dietzia cinnamea TaxID=321318 RepID=UPI00223B92C3|nr:hypothetical protein [Dietzia cinnamea]MCT1639208.1 hypothetical protein [Dietzia cinnamea]MCT2031501.1 hypothetical protein [Dietzia cinnamea]MCT2173264.1 hypothetical protein [Dietzia cinnamea]
MSTRINVLHDDGSIYCSFVRKDWGAPSFAEGVRWTEDNPQSVRSRNRHGETDEDLALVELALKPELRALRRMDNVATDSRPLMTERGIDTRVAPVFHFPGPFRVKGEKLFRFLDRLAEAGQTEVSVSGLREFV